MGLKITIDCELLLLSRIALIHLVFVAMADYFVWLIIIITTPGVWVVRAVSVTTSEWGHLSRGWWPPTSSDTAGVRQNWGLHLRDVYSGGDDILCCRPQVSPRPWQHLTVTTFFCLLTSRITMLLSSTDRRGRTLLLFCTVLVQSVVSPWSLKNVVWWIFDMKTDIRIRPRQDWSLWCLKIYLYCFYLMHFLLMHVSAL